MLRGVPRCAPLLSTQTESHDSNPSKKVVRMYYPLFKVRYLTRVSSRQPWVISGSFWDEHNPDRRNLWYFHMGNGSGCCGGSIQGINSGISTGSYFGKSHGFCPDGFTEYDTEELWFY